MFLEYALNSRILGFLRATVESSEDWFSRSFGSQIRALHALHCRGYGNLGLPRGFLVVSIHCRDSSDVVRFFFFTLQFERDLGSETLIFSEIRISVALEFARLAAFNALSI